MERSRRKVMLGGAAVLGGTGAAAGLRGLFSGPDLRSTYVTTEATGPIVETGPSANDGPLYYATLVTSADDQRYDPSVLPETTRDDWTGVDFDSVFIACFLSREVIMPGGASPGDRLRSRIDGQTFQFVLDGSELELAPSDSSTVYHVLQRWSYTGRPPEDAAVLVEY